MFKSKYLLLAMLLAVSPAAFSLEPPEHVGHEREQEPTPAPTPSAQDTHQEGGDSQQQGSNGANDNRQDGGNSSGDGVTGVFIDSNGNPVGDPITLPDVPGRTVEPADPQTAEFMHEGAQGNDSNDSGDHDSDDSGKPPVFMN